MSPFAPKRLTKQHNVSQESKTTYLVYTNTRYVRRKEGSEAVLLKTRTKKPVISLLKKANVRKEISERKTTSKADKQTHQSNKNRNQKQHKSKTKKKQKANANPKSQKAKIKRSRDDTTGCQKKKMGQIAKT